MASYEKRRKGDQSMPDSQFPSSSSSLPHVPIWGWEIFPSFDHRSLEAHAFPRIIMWEIFQTRKSNFSHRLTIGRLSPPVCLYPPFLCLFFRWELGTLWIGMFWRPEYPKKKSPFSKKRTFDLIPDVTASGERKRMRYRSTAAATRFQFKKWWMFFLFREKFRCVQTHLRLFCRFFNYFNTLFHPVKYFFSTGGDNFPHPLSFLIRRRRRRRFKAISSPLPSIDGFFETTTLPFPVFGFLFRSGAQWSMCVYMWGI